MICEDENKSSYSNMNNTPYDTTKTCSETATAMLEITDSLKGWNITAGLYEGQSTIVETSICECCEDARCILEKMAFLTMMGSVLELAGRNYEAELCATHISEQKAKLAVIATRCSELIQKYDAADDNRADELTALLHPVLSYMAQARIANISINQLGKESR